MINAVQNFSYGTMNRYAPLQVRQNQQVQVPAYGEEYMLDCIKNNQDYIELKNNKYFQSVNIPYLMSHLRQKRDVKIMTLHNFSQTIPGVIIDYIDPALRIDYQQYDIHDYLRILNDFVKTDKISEDLKEYYIETQIENLDVYYTVLNKVPQSKTKREAMNYIMHRPAEI